MAARKKVFILDTNVILHDSSCLFQFEQNDIVIPITVLEELDNFKKGSQMLNFHAREFARSLDSLDGRSVFKDGIRISKGLGKVKVRLNLDLHPDLQKHFAENKPDHRVLNVAYHVSKEISQTPVILVTKDVNLRMKARSIGLKAEDYLSDSVSDVGALYTGLSIVEDIPLDVINKLFETPYEIGVDELNLSHEPVASECLILRAGQQSAMAVVNQNGDRLSRVEKPAAYGIIPRNAEQIFALHLLMNDDIPLVSITGKAGTGKTLLALAAALERRRFYRQIFLSRPVVPLSNKDIGYLPGDIQSKLDPYMQPLFDNLAVIQNRFSDKDKKYNRINEFLLEEKLVIQALSYIRGRSMVKTYFVIDEAQNLTPHEVKTIITRAGEGTKVIFTGDIFQIDHPYLDSQTNGLSYLIEKMKGQKLYAHINLVKGERSELAELAASLL